MCGIAMIVGPGAAGQRPLFDGMLAAVAPRGEVQEVLGDDAALLGTARLRIVDRDRAVQPWISGGERWALNFNGEVFNHAELRAQLHAEGRPTRSTSDTEVVLESFLAWGEDALLRMRGEFAFAVTERDTRRVFLARDPAGVKPLYWAHAGGRLHVASEIKALVPLGVAVAEVPPGHCGWADPDTPPALHPYLDLGRLGEGGPVLGDVVEAADALRRTFTEAVRIRVDTDLRVGVVLSGGLDSSLTLIKVRELHPDCVAFTIGVEGSEDLAYARRLTADLGVEHVVIPLRPRELGRREVREAIRVSELTEYGDIINAVVSQRLFAEVHRRGVKVVLTGDGSDELFGGYDMYRRVAQDDVRRLFLHKIRYLSHTELQRVDRTSMGNGVEARVPFLDVAMLDLAMRIPQELKQRDGYEKWIVRHAFADVLPDYIAARHKNPMSHSSGLHERIRLFRPFFPSMYRSFGYACFAPLQRDFSEVLRDHGYDLDAAVAAARPARDLTVAEHARDLAGALRWNLVHLLRRRPAPPPAALAEARQG
ncbi:asparagine synthetase B family protein [Geodermatophilus ruber]|uniref:asparagine synthase (glutamine-hydrolyzing) n=1 Tax=Geodermatophilus ruber TaxID=504800 RepID=A0A1I4IP30_9ACTN|nr:asparagine synthase-related protein [Geodermatophilus ruber]SFL55827.1 asparagine synthase (glutamine-hydrolysing) [Geodermatophilus ruber]